jgi:fructose-1,6-bisphosphatase I
VAQQITLETYLTGWGTVEPDRRPVASVLKAIADAGRQISDVVAQGALAGNLARSVGRNSDGDERKGLDALAHDLLVRTLEATPVAWIASEEAEVPIQVDLNAPLAVALDPLDGSSNIETNVPIGTIFSVLPVAGAGNGAPESVFLQPGSQQLAAGYVIYGAQCALALTLGKGTHVFTLDRGSGAFRMTCPVVQVPERVREYAINASNYRHWSASIRAYIDDCIAGTEGPRGDNFNTRWLASLVGECHRILSRGGVFLYPQDARRGYEQGRLRLIYEANPIAWLVERAGGLATNGCQRILDLVPSRLHERTPLIFGSREEVELIARYTAHSYIAGDRSPLFNQRGLFRAW